MCRAGRDRRQSDAMQAAAVLAWSLLAAGCAGTRGADSPGIVLHEVHTQPQVTRADTIVTYITSRRVLVSHAGGHTLLDLDTDRIAFLDPATRTVREMSLQRWEARLQEAVSGRVDADRDVATGPRAGGADSASAPAVGWLGAVAVESYEPTGGSTEIAGYTCDGYHYYGQRTLLGAEETVEQQIWVARSLEMPAGAYEAYQRALGSVESVGAGMLLRRPPGVILAVETRTDQAGARHAETLDIERTIVIRVERMPLPDSVFAIPRGYVPAVDREPARPGQH